MKTVTFNGKELTLRDDAYINQTCEDIALGCEWGAYYAWADDEEGESYEVRWEITHPDPSECDDEHAMCDWDKYTIRKL